MVKKIIGLMGKAGSGKDTVRAIMENYGFVGKAFADPLRDMTKGFFNSGGISLDYMTERSLKEAIIPELGFSYRTVVQTLGTEWGRSLSPDVWLNIVKSGIEKSHSTKFVISDVRFPNEFEWIIKAGGEVWQIDRDVPGVRAHASESSLYGYTPTLVVNNNNDIESLARSIDVLLANRDIYEVTENWSEP
jgi:hypothetical protein